MLFNHIIRAFPILLVLGVAAGMTTESAVSICKKSSSEQETFRNQGAMDGICSRSVEISLPEEQKEVQYVWVRAFGWGFEVHEYVSGQSFQRRWFKLNSPNRFSWAKVATVKPGSLKKIVLIYPRCQNESGNLIGAIDCAVLTKNIAFNPVSIQDLWEERQIRKELKKKQGRSAMHENGGKREIAIGNSANIPLDPPEDLLRVFAKERLKEKEIQFEDFSISTKSESPVFVGVWVAASEKELKHQNVSVAQDAQNVKRAISLPNSREIPIGKKFAALELFHTVKGAGEPGEMLFDYQIHYLDGKTVTIPVREGERIGGQLKSADVSLASPVFSSIVENRTVTGFRTVWKNPRPEIEMESITLRGIKKKIIPILLGIRGLENCPEEMETPVRKIVGLIDFGKRIRPVRSCLFGTNVPYLLNKNKDAYFTDFHEIHYSVVRIWNRCHPKKKNDILDEKMLEEQSEKILRLTKNGSTRILLNLGGCPKWLLEEKNPDQSFEFLSDWYRKVLEYGLSRKGWPVEVIELFNEELIGHPEQEVQLKFRLYNYLAVKIKEKYPRIKVGGTTECWPDLRIYERFLQSCGKNVDVLTWHMYATGKSTTPLNHLFSKTDAFAKSSIRLKEIADQYCPGRKIEQAITEYNMNYAAWKPVDRRLVKGIGSIWTFSVLRNLLYDGACDFAMFWHYWGGGTYGSVGGDGEIRPSGMLFYLLNRYLSGAELVQAETNHPEVELLAAEKKDSRVIVLVNKSAKRQSFQLCIANLPIKPSSPFESPVTEYAIGKDDENFSVKKLAYPSRRILNLSIEPYTLRFLIIP